MDLALRPLIRSWKRRNMGFALHTDTGDIWIPVVLWADNIFLLSKDWDEWEQMFNELSTRLFYLRLNLKEEATEVLPSSVLPSFEEHYGAKTLNWVGKSGDHRVDVTGVTHLKALGVSLDREGATAHSFDHRRGQADANFFAHRQDLRTTRAGPEDRIRAFQKTAGSSMAFGSNGWTWTKEMCKQVHAWERLRLRSVLRIRWRGPESKTWSQHMRDSAVLLDSLFVKYDITPLYRQMLASVLGWAHQLLRLHWQGPEYPLAHLVQARGEAWWRGCAPLLVKAARRDQDFKDAYRHRRPGGRTKGWDWLLVEVIGMDWASRLVGVSNLTKQAKANFAKEAEAKLGVKKIQIREIPIVTARPKQILKKWNVMAREAHDADFGKILQASKKQSGIWKDEVHHWPMAGSFEAISDNQLVTAWVNGEASADGAVAKKDMDGFWRLLEVALKLGVQTKTYHHALAHWMPRDLTAAADLICNMVLDVGHSMCWTHPNASEFLANAVGMRWIGDGAARENGRSSYATIGLATYKELKVGGMSF